MVVKLTSPVQYARTEAAAYPYPLSHATFLNGFDDANFIRKRPSDFGWDWGPAVGALGVWRNLSLVAYDDVNIADIWVEVNLKRAPAKGRGAPTGRDSGWPPRQLLHDEDVFMVDVRVALRCPGPGPSSSQTLTAKILGLGVAPTASVTADCDPAAADTVTLVPLRVARSDVELWWPRGYGAQPLYTVEVTVGAEVARRRIGFRELLLVRDALPSGEEGLSM